MVYLFLRHPLNAVLQDSISASKNEEQQVRTETFFKNHDFIT